METDPLTNDGTSSAVLAEGNQPQGSDDQVDFAVVISEQVAALRRGGRIMAASFLVIACTLLIMGYSIHPNALGGAIVSIAGFIYWGAKNNIADARRSIKEFTRADALRKELDKARKPNDS